MGTNRHFYTSNRTSSHGKCRDDEETGAKNANARRHLLCCNYIGIDFDCGKWDSIFGWLLYRTDCQLCRFPVSVGMDCNPRLFYFCYLPVSMTLMKLMIPIKIKIAETPPLKIFREDILSWNSCINSVRISKWSTIGYICVILRI